MCVKILIADWNAAFQQIGIMIKITFWRTFLSVFFLFSLKCEGDLHNWHPIIINAPPCKPNPSPLENCHQQQITDRLRRQMWVRSHICTFTPSWKRHGKTSGKSKMHQKHTNKWRRGERTKKAPSTSVFSLMLIIYVVCAFYYYYLFTFFSVCGTFLLLSFSLLLLFYARFFDEKQSWHALLPPLPRMCKHISNIYLTCISPPARK